MRLLAIRWARVFCVLFLLALIGDIVFLVLKPDRVSEMLSEFFESFAGQTVLFLGLPVLLLLILIFTVLYAISCVIRWSRRE